MFKKAKNQPESANISDIQPQNIDTTTDTESYRAELTAMVQANQERRAWLKRELERQQNLISAAAGMEKAAKDRLRAEQDELNRLEEESRAAILALAEAKQKSDRLTEEYNRLLERVKDQRSQADHQTDDFTAQQQQARQLIDELQQLTFFGNRQEQALAELDTGATDLPPLEELIPPEKPEPANPAKSEKNHANADFWEKGSQHTALKLREPATEPEPELKSESESEPEPEPEAEEKRPGKLRVILSYIICIALAVAVALAIRTWVLMPTEVSGSSMAPTLQSADKLLTSPLPYLWGEPQRGDIIVFQAPNEAEGVYYVKRVVGLPGERVLIDDGLVYINGKPLSEPYLTDTTTEGYVDTIVPEDSVFVLGDNRIVSHDSRANDVACISYDEIYGKALWRFAPFDDFGTIY